MAWSVKLRSGAGGIDGYNEWETIFNPSTQTAYKATYNISLGSESPDVLYHTPDNGSPVPIRATGKNRVVFLEMHIPPQTSWDNVLNKIAPIARLVDGANSQAMRAQTGGAEAVTIAIKPDGATNTTYFNVLHGFVDTSRAFTQDVSMLNKTAYKVVIALTCSPFGYGAAFTLRNDLPSSPHMIEDTNADGLSDGMALVGAPTAARASINYLTGGVSQKITTDNASDQGIQTGTVTVGAGVSVVGYVDLLIAGDGVSVILRDDVAVLQVKAFTQSDGGGVSSRYYTDLTGAKFYRVEVSGTTSVGATGCYMQVRRGTATATQVTNIVIDKFYLQINTSTVPPAFVSSTSLKNRNDPSSSSAATRQQINYLDVWGVPGDVPALVRQKWSTSVSSVGESLLVAKTEDTKYRVTSYKHFIDSDEFTPGTGWTETADAALSGGSYCGSSVANANPMSLAISDPLIVAKWAEAPVRVFGLLYATSSVTTFRVEITSGPQTFATAEFKPNTTSAWRFVDMGLINLSGITPSDWSLVGPLVSVKVYATGSLGTVRVDGIWLFPTYEFLQTPLQSTGISGIDPAIDGKEEATYLLDGVVYYQAPSLGDMRTVLPGTKITRFIYFLHGTEATPTFETFALANTLTIPSSSFTFEVTPRTSHLLGTA